MGAPERLIKKIEKARKERRQSRKESRATLVNSKRNLILEETKKVQPELSEAEKLKLWRIEKKRKMDEEKLRRRPPFITFVNVKHTEFRYIFQQIENVKQPVPARTIAKQTKTVPIKPETTLKKLENMRITRQNANKVLPASVSSWMLNFAAILIEIMNKPFFFLS
uniref:Uncharacterized protein n=1 Tax=Rhodnius prolixus TaxID=13249 RepID=T1I1M5_RHOPR